MPAQLVGYGRVSTAAQSLRAQRDALTAAGCARIYTDQQSGAAERPGLGRALRSLRPGDALLVTRLDRLGRSMPHLVSTVRELSKRGVAFRSLAESIDTASATGRLVLHLFSALAEFERELVSERTTAALNAKRARGESVGRPLTLTPTQAATVERMWRADESPTHIARVLRVSRATIYRTLERRGVTRA